MSKEIDSKKVLLQHSEAKVELLESYLSVYLNILHRAQGINTIYLYDLFAGEGIYDNGKKGSPLVILEVIKNHYFSNNKDCPHINILINEPRISEIEPGTLKIERIKREADKIFNPPKVTREFDELGYNEVIKNVLGDIENMTSNERALLFIDPWGYSQVKFEDIISIMKSGRVELILFLPIYFMYRFANKSLSDDDFPSGVKLEAFLRNIFENEQPDLTDQEAFIDSIKESFRKRSVSKYVDTFVIERSKGQLFSLFFFTNHLRGAEKMLEAKWRLDDSRGKGFRIDEVPNQSALFKGVEGSNYPRLMLDYIKENELVTNSDIYDFGLRKGFLPKHSNKVLKKLKKDNKIVIESLDGKAVKGNYLTNANRTVAFKIKN